VIPHKIAGNALQHVTCQLPAGQVIYGEPGKFLWKTASVMLETRLSGPQAPGGGGGSGGLLGRALDVGKRVLAGEHLAFEYFSVAQGSGLVGFAGAVPGELRALELDGGAGWLTERGAFVAAETSVAFDIAFTGLRAGLRGGEGLVLEHFTGSGTMFIAAAGNFIELNPARYGGTIQVHAGCLAAFQDTLHYDVQRLSGVPTQALMNAAFGEGSVVATLSGDGTVLIQSVTLTALARTLQGHMTAQGGERKTGLGQLLGS
jgi:uncharacterized protein (AIM24 family)